MDSGSQTNIITEELVRRYKLPYEKDKRPISGINQSKTNANKVSNIRIKSTQSRFTATIECLVLKTITEPLPQMRIDADKLYIPKDIPLADSDFSEPGNIDLLIVAGLYWQILQGKPKNSTREQPALQNTKLSWIIGGEVHDNLGETCTMITNDVLSRQIEKFWIQEEVTERPYYTTQERACEKYFIDTVTRDATGRFIVRLLIKSEVTLGHSKQFALKRLLSMERRFIRDPALKVEYIKFMGDYLDQGHMSLLTESDDLKDSEGYILPHQAVLRPESETTKLRIVFDASARTTLGISLNDKLMAGPNLQRELVDIILRFRTHEYVITADVAMMFRQILVDKKDRVYQRILWRRNPDESIQTFELNTVTYGTTCAPYLAMKCLRQLAEDEGEQLPQAAKVIGEDCYMDDVLTGCDTVEETIALQKQLSELLARGQFHLRKWRANDGRIL